MYCLYVLSICMSLIENLREKNFVFEKAVAHVAQLYIKCKAKMLFVNLNWQLNNMP